MWRERPEDVRPMLATLTDAPLVSSTFAYEPKYDGIRALVALEPARGGPRVRFWSRLGNEKTAQFPEIADALRVWGRGLRRPLLLDGEIVALGPRGEPAGFQRLQGRMHLKGAGEGAATPSRPGHDAALFVFDLLRDGDVDLRPLAYRERRRRLEGLFAEKPAGPIRISEQAVGDGRAMQARALSRGWEGLLAKHLDSTYKSGRRSTDWRKLKLVRTQSCVVGGWTDPRGSRPHLGALILGVYDERQRLQYIGHAGSGFTDAELERVWTRLRPLQTAESPFAVRPPVNERPHWVKPLLVAEVKFTEWTTDGVLRHPTYLGLRDDIDPARVRREPDVPTDRMQASRPTRAPGRRRSEVRRAEPAERTSPTAAETAALLAQLDAIAARGGSGVLALPGGDRLDVTNLGKVFWPRARLTKGDLLRHYVRVAPLILPILADRPLVMKRYPNGVDRQSFYQHRAPDAIPSGIRAAAIEDEGEAREYLIGGSLKTLLYTAQLASISQDPWFSRLDTLDQIDYAAIDLDPAEGLPFARVRDVARWVRDELDGLRAPAFPKTSGASGLHVYVPMARGTSYEAGLLFCQIVATKVAHRHPGFATVERSLRKRGSRVYVDYMQNARGKTLASAYSARASQFAGVSTPLTWSEIDGGVSPEDFPLHTFAARLADVGDLWASFRTAAGVDLRAIARRAAST